MPPFVIIAIACAMAVGQSPATTPVDQGLVRVCLVIGSMIVSCMMARIVVIACLDGSSVVDGLPFSAEKRRTRWERWHLFVWLGMTAFLLYGVGWGTLVRINWGLESSILIDELIILTPLLLPWLISWAYFYDLETNAVSSTANAHPSANRTSWSWSDLARRRTRFAMQHARWMLGLGLLPVLLVCLISDSARAIAPELAGQPIPSRYFVVPMALLAIAYPLLIRRMWKTSPLPAGELRDALLSFTDFTHFRFHEMYVWHTDGKTLNAAVTGIVPRLRYLFFTDRLLAELPEREVIAAMAHEFGHLQHRHLLLRMMAIFFPVSAIVMLGAIAAWTSDGLGMSTNVAHPAISSEALTAATVIVTVLYLWQVIGGYSRQLELEADMTGWRLLATHLGSDETARETYVSMLKRISHDGGGEGGWLHPPIASRIHAIETADCNSATNKVPIRLANRFLSWAAKMLSLVTLTAILVVLFEA